MKKIISISIIIAIIIAAISVNYANNFISENRPDVIKPSEIVTQSNTTGKHYEVGVSDGMGFKDKR